MGAEKLEIAIYESRVTGNLGTITNRTRNRVLLGYFFGRDSGGTKPATR
jgi:hypothetical protein